MAALLKMVVGLIPWGDIVKAAPSIISAARGTREKTEPMAVNTDRITPGTPPDEAFELIREDISLLRTLVGELQTDSARKSRVLQEMSEQNLRLSDAVLSLRARLRVTLFLALIALAGAGAAIWIIAR